MSKGFEFRVEMFEFWFVGGVRFLEGLGKCRVGFKGFCEALDVVFRRYYIVARI